MSYHMKSGVVSQAAAGIGALTSAYDDGIFEVGGPAASEFGQLLQPWRDGVFGPGLGADAAPLDMNDPAVMKEIKIALGLWEPSGVTDAWLASPAWDTTAESKFQAFAAQAATTQPATVSQLVGGHVVPTGAGIQSLYLGAGSVLGADKAKANLPILSAWVASTQGAGPVKAPASFGSATAEAGIFSKRNLIIAGVSVGVIAVGYMLLKK